MRVIFQTQQGHLSAVIKLTIIKNQRRKTLKIRKEASLKEYLSKYNIEKGWESFHQVIHKHWKRYLREIIIQALETLCQAFLACFAASANKFCIYRQYMHIAFILQCQKIQNKLPNYLKRAETSIVLIVFSWCPLWILCVYSYCFLPSDSLYMNKGPEKWYLGQWPYITNIYPINAIWLLV